MLDVSKLKQALNAGNNVILKKAAKGPHPVSYSLVTNYEWDNVWRTPFEAESPDEVYDFGTGHYTFSKNLANNSRVSIYKIVEPKEDFNDEDFDDEDYDVPQTRGKTVVSRDSETIARLQDEIINLQRQVQRLSNPVPTQTPVQTPTRSRWRRVAI